MSHTDTESAIKNNRYILFASIPVGIILGFLKFTNIYEFDDNRKESSDTICNNIENQYLCNTA